jgi:uncharacterized membrane protein YfcA
MPVARRVRGKNGWMHAALISDPLFYMVAIPAVLLFGISKGGFGGGLGVMAVPLMALAVSPLQAAAILLPILCLMDVFGVWAWRGRWLWSELRILLPASMIGIAVGAMLFDYMSPAVIRLLLGLIAVSFTIHHWLRSRFGGTATQSLAGPAVGVAAAAMGGFTSFIAHSGGPPIGMYLLRRNLDRTSFAATAVYLFMVINYVKLVPYAWLGQFEASNLLTSLVLAPLAPIGIYTGVWLHKRVSDKVFFRIAYALLFIVGLKLLWDGLGAVFPG